MALEKAVPRPSGCPSWARWKTASENIAPTAMQPSGRRLRPRPTVMPAPHLRIHRESSQWRSQPFSEQAGLRFDVLFWLFIAMMSIAFPVS